MGIDQFKSFGKKKAVIKQDNREVWGYTRVSSKEQVVNNSLENQDDDVVRYCKQHGFILTERFGRTYESASGGLNRKEFARLINMIIKSKKRPYAILINRVNRFSRTGGGAIGFADQLVEELGVHLIETSSGKSTVTHEGRLEIYELLIDARKDNLTKLGHTIPGMIKHLKNGNWLGKVPRGYDHFGPKVKDIRRIREKQEILINEEGRIFQQAWNWKIEGEKDCAILKRLADLGIKITKQGLSEMWRNPFYCGISTSKLLNGEVVEGNWKKIVSQQDFLHVQEILKGNTFGYKHNNSDPTRPLSGFICCNDCGKKMAGYEVKNKHTHYYKCQKCLGISINAVTTKKAKGKGANELFKDFLLTYELPSVLIDDLKEQIRMTYNAINFEQAEEKEILTKQLEKIEADLKALKVRHATTDMDSEIYNELKNDFELKISQIKSRIDGGAKKISNLDNHIDASLEIVTNVSEYWASSDLEIQKYLQEVVFPGGIVIDTKNRVYLTKEVNTIFQESARLARLLEDKKKNDNGENPLSSSVVSRSRLELPTFGL
jgi:site-specific DNA recombinase